MRLRVALAALGFAIAGLLFAYLEFTNYARVRPLMLCTSVVLCPPCLLSALFLDIEPHSGAAVFGWFVIAAANAALYVAIGGIISRYLHKPTGGLQEKPRR